jgi:hypothetical protein
MTAIFDRSIASFHAGRLGTSIGRRAAHVTAKSPSGEKLNVIMNAARHDAESAAADPCRPDPCDLTLIKLMRNISGRGRVPAADDAGIGSFVRFFRM